MEDFIKELGIRVREKKITWEQASKIFNKEYGMNLSGEALRNRHRRMKDRVPEAVVNDIKEFETHYGDNSIEAQKIVEYNKEIFGDKTKLLEYLGYNSSEWEFVFFTTSVWMQHTKEQTTKQLYAVKYKIRPILDKDLSVEEALESAKEAFKKEIIPIKLEKKSKDTSLEKNKLLEIPAIELHLGKMSWNGDTGEDYDKNIAINRFTHIMEEILEQQEIEKCSECLIAIGNDFFNSDTVNATTTKGTPQTNDLRWKKMFLIGLEMYKTALLTLRERFNKVNVRLCSGNHDKMASFYLYMALSQYFKDDNIIEFSDNYKDVQCYVWGKNLIAFTHGDSNLKRLIKSIPIEFYKEWGQTVFRELHLGHLHKEVVVDDESGMITRRIGSPTATDQWHYEERFLGSTQKAQTFVWDKGKGLLNIKYINFDSKKKQKIKMKQL